MKNSKNKTRIENEIQHFSNLEHIWWGAQTPAGQRRYDNKLKRLQLMCQLKKSHKVLEIGCGDGEFTKRLLTLGCQITATDITLKVVNKGKQAIKAKNISFMVDDAEKMKFKDNSFDIVCGISILHHIDTNKALRESYRVLKKGGQIFFTEPNYLNPHIYAGLHIGWLRQRMEFSPDETALLRWEVVRLLKKIGYSKIAVINYDFLHPNVPSRYINLVENLSNILEKTPLLKEISGSLIVWATK